ncbi:MAG: PQQ-binding-like beta-propeller repeat protein [Thermomicrobiales bacterium]|nr:PQQ-binding-like beta-propeller repeat protein [Thermomicrobiales bacterium]
MTGAESRNPELLILDYWDALLSGRAILPGVDPDVRETIAWLLDHDDADGADSGFVLRTRQQFAGEAPHGSVRAELSEGGPRPTGPSLLPAPGATRRSRWPIWPLAAMLCLALGLALFFGGDSLPGRLADRWSNDPTVPVVFAPTNVPATPVATPSTVATPIASPEALSEGSAELTMLLANPARLGDAEATGPRELPEVAWSFETGRRIRSSPVISGGVVYIGNTDGQMYAFDATSSRVVWQVDAGGSINSTALIAGDVVILAAADMAQPGAVVALDRATGVEVWRVPIGDQVSSDPLLYGEVLYVGSDDGFVYALNPEDGSEVWKVDTGAPVAFPAAIDDGALVVGNRAGTLLALDAASGNELWTLEPNLASLVSDPGAITDHAWSMPLIADGRVIVAYRPITQEFIAGIVAYAIDLHNGEIVWQRTDLLSGGPLIFMWDEGLVRVITQSFSSSALLFQSFDPVSGNDLGEPTALVLSAGASQTGGVIAGERLYLSVGGSGTNSMAGTSGSGRLNVYDLSTGELIGRVDLPGVSSSTELADGRPPIVVDGSIYLGTAGGGVFALRVAEAAPVASPEALANESAGVPMLMGSPARLGDAGAIGPAGLPEVAWSFETGRRMRSSPVVAGGVVYIGNSDGQMFAFDAGNGGIAWQVDAGGSISSTALIAGDLVIVAAADMAQTGFVMALDRGTGDEVWRFPIGNQVLSDMLLYDGIIYLGSDDGFVYALNSGDGGEVWKVDTGAPVSFPAAIDDGVLVVGNRAGMLIALDAVSGEERWTLTPDLASLVANPDAVTEHTWSMPMIADERVIVAYRPISYDSNAFIVAYALDLQSGELEWQRDDLLSNGLPIFTWDEGVVRVITGTTLTLISFDPGTGGELGEPITLVLHGGAVATSGVLADNALYLYGGDASGKGTLNVYDLRTGELVGRVTLPGNNHATANEDRPPIVVDGSVYLGASPGWVFAFRTDPETSTATP